MRRSPVGLILVALLLASCTAPIATPSPTTATQAAATATPAPATATPGPTVAGLVFPPGCRYVGAGVVEAASTSWAFDCGAAANAGASGIIRPALIQAGWVFCGGAGGSDFYTKATMTMQVTNPGSAPGALPGLMLLNQRVGNCP